MGLRDKSQDLLFREFLRRSFQGLPEGVRRRLEDLKPADLLHFRESLAAAEAGTVRFTRLLERWKDEDRAASERLLLAEIGSMGSVRGVSLWRLEEARGLARWQGRNGEGMRRTQPVAFDWDLLSTRREELPSRDGVYLVPESSPFSGPFVRAGLEGQLVLVFNEGKAKALWEIRTKTRLEVQTLRGLLSLHVLLLKGLSRSEAEHARLVRERQSVVRAKKALERSHLATSDLLSILGLRAAVLLESDGTSARAIAFTGLAGEPGVLSTPLSAVKRHLALPGPLDESASGWIEPIRSLVPGSGRSGASALWMEGNRCLMVFGGDASHLAADPLASTYGALLARSLSRTEDPAVPARKAPAKKQVPSRKNPPSPKK